MGSSPIVPTEAEKRVSPTLFFFFPSAIDKIGATVALTVFLQQLLYELRILPHPLLIAVIAIDQHHQMAGVQRHLCTLVVTGGRTHATLCITIDG